MKSNDWVLLSHYKDNTRPIQENKIK